MISAKLNSEDQTVPESKKLQGFFLHKFHVQIFSAFSISLAFESFSPLNLPLNLLHRCPNCSFLFSSITLTIPPANEPSSDAGFEPDDALCVRLPARASALCYSASTLDVVHPAVSKLITVIRLKRGGLGSAWPAARSLWTSPVRLRASHTESGGAAGTWPRRRLLLTIGSCCFCLHETLIGAFSCTHAVIMTSL